MTAETQPGAARFESVEGFSRKPGHGFGGGSAPSERARLAIAYGAFILVGLNDGVIGVLLPSIIAHYHISTATVGLLFPAASLGYLCAAFNSGFLLERLGRRVYLSSGALVWIAGMVGFAMLPPFYALLPALFAIGFGVAILDAGLNAYIAELPRGVSLLNYLHAFYGVGALLGPLLATAMLGSVFGWNATYYALALGVAVALVGFALRFERRRVHGAADASSGEGGHGHPGASGVSSMGRGLLRAALRSPVVWLCAIFLFVYVGVEVSLGAWSYSLLTAGRDIATSQAGWMVSGYWLGLTLGRFTLARRVERVGPRRAIQWLTVGVVAGIALVWAPVGAAGAGAWLAALGLWVVGFSLGPIFPSVIAVISALTRPRLRQSAIGFAASLGSMGGAFFPWVAANLAQHLGLWSLLPYTAALTLLLLALWLWLRRNLTPQSGAVTPPGTPA
ncbi:MAG TPA: MFS transporter [Ktedonobacterales bacterium]|nr:MFS transporter [Ktedonobacterales bacterium]